MYSFTKNQKDYFNPHILNIMINATRIFKINRLLVTLIILLFPVFVFGQTNILALKENQPSPNAKLSDISWIAGHWIGEAFGGITEEIWTEPMGGSIMGSFRVVKDGKVLFYELETITEEEETLILRLKHFSPLLIGWEEKDVTVDFKLVKVTDSRVYFDGFTFERINENRINTYVLIKGKEMKFSFQRKVVTKNIKK